MTTYFDGEIIGAQHPFLTRKWHANAKTDRHHWVRARSLVAPPPSAVLTCCMGRLQSKFAAFQPMARTFHQDRFEFDNAACDVIFMRWKVRPPHVPCARGWRSRVTEAAARARSGAVYGAGPPRAAAAGRLL
jgi:hypothetical protein